MQDPFKPVGYRPAPPPVASRSRWRWVLIVLFFLIALAGSAVVLGPSLIDWNAYKAPFAEAVRRATGRELVVAGDLSLELLPRPRLVARDVSLGNALGGSQPEMVRVGRLEARLAPWPLLSGRFELRSLDLIEPTILLERLSDGAGNWEGVVEHLSQEGRQGRLRLALEHVRIAGGTALWRGRDGSVRKLEKVDASLTAPPLGPAAISGTGRVGETPVRFEAALPAGAQGGPVRVLVSAGDGEAEASGALLGGEAFGYTGKLRVKSASLARSLTALDLVEGPLPAGMDQPLSAEAEVKIGGSRLEASSLRIEFGGAVAGGKGALDFDARRAQLELAMSRLDLDAWPKNESGTAWPISFPAGWSGEGRLSIEALVWQAGIISQVR
ncbi:MAG TPA: AsmA family protein, partial [Alphaproteobacteria bacterium]|nr:AsmA family protein [Alphaproteobacteria bacterium]